MVGGKMSAGDRGMSLIQGKTDSSELNLAQGGSGLLITGQKVLQPPVDTELRVLDRFGRTYVVASYPMDQGANYLYHSRAGGFVPPEVAGDSCLSQLHYGEGFFEGMRFLDSPFGSVLRTPWENFARFIHSATVFNPAIAKLVLDSFAFEAGLESIAFQTAMTPGEYYALAKAAYFKGHEISYPLTFTYANEIKKTVNVELSLKALDGTGHVRKFSMRELDTIVKVLAFTNRLVSVDYFPLSLRMTPAGYIRPWGWVGGSMGLKIPSVVVSKRPDGSISIGNKPLTFAIATLPWGLYLNENDYACGLDVMISPYPRIGTESAYEAKVSGGYVNSALAINLGVMLGFGEILALTRDGRVVEGSAENLFVIRTEGGKQVVYTPPIGDGCLPGTTRDSMIRTIERMGLELRYKSLPLEEIYGADGVLLTGTGAQMIHARSISELPAAGRIAEMARLRSEDKIGEPGSISRCDFQRDSELVNGGVRHPVIDEIRDAYNAFMLEDAEKNVVSVTSIHWETFARLLGLDLGDFTTTRDRKDIAAGRFDSLHDTRKGGTEEMRSRYVASARMITKAIALRERRDRQNSARVR